MRFGGGARGPGRASAEGLTGKKRAGGHDCGVGDHGFEEDEGGEEMGVDEGEHGSGGGEKRVESYGARCLKAESRKGNER